MRKHQWLSMFDSETLPTVLCLVLCLLWAAAPVAAQQDDPLTVRGTHHLALTEHLQFAAGVPAHFGAPLLYHSYRQPRSGQTPQYVQWQPTESFRRPLFTNKNWWFAVTLASDNAVSEDFILAINSARVYDAEVFVYREGQLQHHYTIGTLVPFDARPLDTRFYALPVTLQPDDRYDLLIRSSGAPHLVFQNLELWPRESYFAHGQPKAGFQWFYYGIMSVICIAAFGLSAFLRSRGFLYYGLFVLFSTLFFFITEGFAFQYLWPESSWLASRMHLVVVVVAVATRILFVDELLNMRSATPVVHRINMVLVTLTLLTGLAPLFASMQYAFNIPFLAMFLSVPSHLLLFGTACWLWRRGNSEAGWYALIWLVYASMHVLPIASGGTRLDPYAYAQLGDGLLALGLFGILLRRIARLMHDERQARAESQAKSDFLARMSHELRTPMTGVLGTADLLAETPLNRSQHYQLQLIQKCGHALLAVINDVLDSSKIAAGKMDLDIRPTRVDALVSDCVDIFATKAGEKNLSFLADVDDDVPPCIRCDAPHIRQILINLLSNAFKFTEAGGVQLHVGLASERKDTLEIRVRDSGIGIEPALQKKLFTPFQQGDTAISRRYGGTGLGLVICKQLAELMHGDISVESEPGRGTTFTLTLPCVAAPSEIQSPLEYPLSGKQLLVSIPDSSYREFCERRLRGWGAEVTQLETAEQLPGALATTLYDLLLIDVGADELLVKKLSRWYTQHSKRFPNTLVLQHRLSENGKRVLAELPVFLEIERPIIVRTLLEPIQATMDLGRSATETGEAAAASPAVTGQRLNILLAEDNAVNQTVFRGMVTNLGHRLTVAENGARALERYQKSLRGRRSFYDVILMDCEMPEVNGYEATRRIRELERDQRLTPVLIIAVTANASGEHIRQCHDAGMDDVMTKPINLAALRARLEDVTLRLHEPS